MKKNKKILITTLISGAVIVGSTLVGTLVPTYLNNNNITKTHNISLTSNQLTKNSISPKSLNNSRSLVTDAKDIAINNDQYKTINLLNADGTDFTGNIITNYQLAFTSTKYGLIVPTDDGVKLVDSQTLKIKADYKGLKNAGRTLVQAVYDEGRDLLLLVSSDASNQDVIVTALNPTNLKFKKTLKLGDGDGRDKLSMTTGYPFLFKLGGTDNSYILMPRGPANITTRSSETYQFWLQDGDDVFGNTSDKKPTTAQDFFASMSNVTSDSQTKIMQAGAYYISTEDKNIFTMLEVDMGSKSLKLRIYYDNVCYQQPTWSVYWTQGERDLNFINPYLVLNYDDSSKLLYVNSVINFNDTDAGNIAFDYDFNITQKKYINEKYGNLQTTPSTDGQENSSARRDYDFQTLNYSPKLNRIYGYASSTPIASGAPGIIQFDNINKDSAYGKYFNYTNDGSNAPSSTKALPLFDFVDNSKQNVIIVPSWDGNQYYSFVPNNGAKYTVYNAENGINRDIQANDPNYNPYAYETSIISSSQDNSLVLDLSDNTNINQILTNDTDIKNKITTALNGLLADTSGLKFFNQYLLGSTVELGDNIVPDNTNGGSVTINEITINNAFDPEKALGPKTWQNVKIIGFKKFDPTTLSATIGINDLSLVPGNVGEIPYSDFVPIYIKIDLENYFDLPKTKNKYNIPADATISVGDIDASKAPQGEIEIPLTLSKYYADDKSVQENATFTCTVTGFKTYKTVILDNFNPELTYDPSDIDIKKVSPDDIKNFILKKVQAGHIFGGQFVGKNSPSELNIDDLNIEVLGPNLAADNSKGQYAVNLSLNKDVVYENGVVASNNLSTPQIIIKGFKQQTPTNISSSTSPQEINLNSEKPSNDNAVKQAFLKEIKNVTNLPVYPTAGDLQVKNENGDYVITFTPRNIYNEKGIIQANNQEFTYKLLFKSTQLQTTSSGDWWWIVVVLGSCIGALLLIMLLTIIIRWAYQRNKKD